MSANEFRGGGGEIAAKLDGHARSSADGLQHVVQRASRTLTVSRPCLTATSMVEAAIGCASAFSVAGAKQLIEDMQTMAITQRLPPRVSHRRDVVAHSR
jgi:tRNA U54 and U55 pseudouridine synthase Pus10